VRKSREFSRTEFVRHQRVVLEGLDLYVHWVEQLGLRAQWEAARRLAEQPG